jgi:uncharacterized protein with NRDE domain
MCLIAFAWGLQPDCPFLLASNRDEYWDRPTQALAAWPMPDTRTTVYCGRDARAGGTWLGVNAQGRVAMLTNIRGSHDASAPRSRGELVMRWLTDPQALPDWAAWVEASDPMAYGGFNVVLGDVSEGAWVWLSNQAVDADAGGTPLALPQGWVGRRLPPGLYGLSNAGLDTPWRKTEYLKAATRSALDTHTAPAAALPGLQAALRMAALDLSGPGHPTEPDGALAHPFVHLPKQGYGTRSSLIAACQRQADGQALTLDEWTYAPSGGTTGPGAVAGHRRIRISMWGMPTSS